MGYHGRATAHGFRALASTVLNEAGFKADAIERQLAHLEGNRVRAAYHRSEYLAERRELMRWWGERIEAWEKGANSNNPPDQVITLSPTRGSSPLGRFRLSAAGGRRCPL